MVRVAFTGTVVLRLEGEVGSTYSGGGFRALTIGGADAVHTPGRPLCQASLCGLQGHCVRPPHIPEAPFRPQPPLLSYFRCILRLQVWGWREEAVRSEFACRVA